MNIAIAHLSDIHFQKPAEKNPVLSKSLAIIAAIRSATMNADFVVFVISGDVAYSGHNDEYESAVGFLSEIIKAVAGARRPNSCACVVIPGNHDCDFSDDDGTRDMLLEQIPKKVLKDSKPISSCLSVQTNYQTFAGAFTASLAGIAEASVLTEWFATTSFQYAENVRIVFNLLNTAWCSVQKEKQGTLHQPCYLLSEALRQADTGDDIVVSVFHHPFNWYDATNARELRRLLEANCDLLLTGHEHETGVFSKTANTGGDNTYVEGGVLQETGQPSKSTFLVIRIDPAARTQDSITYRYDDSAKRYEPVEDSRNTLPFIRNRTRLNGTFPFEEGFEAWLTDAGVRLSHPTKQTLTLDDVFVCPDLREVSKDEKPDSGIVHGRRIKEVLEKSERLLLIGPEASGKTTLAKHLIKTIRPSGQVTLYITGLDLTRLVTSRGRNSLDPRITEQFGKRQIEPFWQLERDRRSVIVDDYQHCALPPAQKSAALEWLAEHFKYMVVLATDDVRLEELQRSPGASLSLYDFKHLEIMELGHALRSAMVQKWYGAAGNFGTVPTTSRPLHEIESQITSALGERLMPAYPLCILVILQQLELANRPDLGGSSLGFIYDALVVASLAVSTTQQSDIDTNRTYLSEFAYYLFCEKQQFCTQTDYRLWHDRHCKRYQLTIECDRHLAALTKANLLVIHDGVVEFRYPYLFYYFCGFYFSSHVKDGAVQEHIKTLSSYLHQIDAANIILFTCHFTRDPSVIDCVCQTADALFASHQQARLDDDVKQIAFPAADAIPLDLGKNDPELNRQEVLREADERELATVRPPNEAQQMLYDKQCEVRELNEQLQLGAALKTIQIIGQILRNHIGSLPGDVKEQLVKTCTSLGLRSMDCLLKVFRENLPEMVRLLVQAVDNRKLSTLNHKAVDPRKRREDANRSLWSTAELGVVAIVKYVSDSIGSERLAETFDNIFDEQSSPALSTIDLSIRLDHYAGFPEKQTLDLVRRFEGNPFAFAVVRDLVWGRFYLYSTEYRIRQRVCEKLLIGAKGQRRIIAVKGGRDFGPGRTKRPRH